MNDNDFQQLPEWLQQEQEEYREREAAARLKVAIGAFAIGFALLLFVIQFCRSGGLG